MLCVRYFQLIRYRSQVGRKEVCFACGNSGQVQSRDADVHNVREGLSPARFRKSSAHMGLHGSAGAGDLQKRKSQNRQALGSEVAGTGAEPGDPGAGG